MEAKKHCHGIHICLVGANRFQNELFVEALKRIHDCRCTFNVVHDFGEGPLWGEDTCPDKGLVYLDCYDLEHDRVIALLQSVHPQIPCGHLLGLFNLAESARIEREALNYGVRGFFYPHASPVDFCRGTRAILRGEIWLSRKMMSDVIFSCVQTISQRFPQNMPSPANLSPREVAVLSVLSAGVSNGAIAASLCISPHTVRTHLYQIYKKINVSNRSQAILWAEKHLPAT